MLSDKNIALFIDVDNANLEVKNFENALYALSDMGKIVYTKVYGVSERKHKDIISIITSNGYDMTHVMRIKKRGSKPLDSRILIDCIEAVFRFPTIDTVAIVSGAGDLVPLFSKLKAMGKKIVCMDNCDDESLKFVDEVIDLGIVEIIKLPSKPKRVKPIVAKPVAVVPVQEKVFADMASIAEVIAEGAPEVKASYVEPPVEELSVEASVEDLELLKQLDELAKKDKNENNDEDLMSQIKNLLSEFND